MNKCKRFLALLLVLCMTLSVVPFGALAAETTGETNDESVVIAEVPEDGEETPETPDEPANPEIPETPEEPANPETPETPEEPANPETPETPEEPADPETPEDPVTPETPAEPDGDDPADEDTLQADEASSDDVLVVAAVEPVPMTASPAETYRILHLDCGRKYFTKDWIVALINEMKAAGFTHLELAIGNDGLRFLLDDMSVTVGEKTYSSDAVKAAIQAGNKAYHDFGTNELTQDEMNEIIAHANSVGIKIIPLLNNPGHMDAIVSAINSLTSANVGYDNSITTINLESETAVAFTQALVQKYIDYFAAKGCNEFNMGADEYANDVYDFGSMGFGQLVSTRKYNLFVNYVNEMANMIKNAGMVPMAFNDGFYFNGNTSSGTFDRNIMVCFWTSGWGGYQSASAYDLRSTYGHEMINTHGNYYYVLGKNDLYTPDNSTYHDPANSNYSAVSSFTATSFMNSEVSDPRGSMFCIWCDYPNAETETQIAANTRSIIRAMGARMQGQSIDNLDVTTDVPGGFKADGTINNDTQTDEVKIVAESGSTALTVGGTTTLSLSNRSSATWTSSDKTVVSLAPAAQTAAFSAGVTGTSVTATALKAGTADITATVDEGTTYELTLTVSEAGVPETVNKTITLQVGASDTRTQKGVNNQNNVDRTYLDETIATVVVEGVDGSEASPAFTQASVSCDTLISSNKNNWTAVSGYYYTPDGTNYYPVYAKRRWNISWNGVTYTYTYTWGYSTTSSTSNVTQIDTQSTTNTGTSPNITVYTQTTTPAVEASTTITFTGVNPGTTYVTVGDTTYRIVVEYKTEPVTVILGQGPVEVSVNGTADISGLDANIATVAFSPDGTIMTVTGVAVGETSVTVGNTIYTIKVTEEDLSTVNPLTLEYWITNGRPTDSNGKKSVSVSAESAYSENGIDVASIAPANTTKENRTLQYWRCRLLDTTLSNGSTSLTEEQTEDSGDDETYNGVEFTKVRYWNGTWSVYTENNEWVAVTNNHQLVAYYLEILPISDELTVTAADWGKKGDGSTSGDYLEPSSSCTVSVQVVYEDGTTNPATTTAAGLASRTIAYGYWSNGRGVGTLNLVGLEGYQIWKVQAETGAVTYASSSSTWGSYTVTNFEWDNNPMTVYEGDPVDSYTIHNNANNPSTDGYYQNLMWDENYEAILIKVYVKAKPTDDNLTVIYYDEKFGDQLYTYSINVNAGVTFADITPEPPAFADNANRIDVTNCGIVNTLGVTQKFQTDLTKVPEAVGKYNSALYTYTGSVISEDRKTLYLYYTINEEILEPIYVVDFGMSIQFPLSAVVSQTSTVQNVSVNASTRYGTLSYDAEALTFTYTPTKILQNIDVLTINITFDGNDTVSTTNVGVMPATTVQYEESFIAFDNRWSGTGAAVIGTQELQVKGASGYQFGYDPALTSQVESNNSAASTSAVGASGTFTFTGTGFEIYADSAQEDSWIFVRAKNADNGSYVYSVNTAVKPGGSATSDQGAGAYAGYYYGLPVVSKQDLPYGTYTVTINKIVGGNESVDAANTVFIDGIRIFDTIGRSNFMDEGEACTTYVELRDQVLAGLQVNVADSKYYDANAKSVLKQVYDATGTLAGAIVLSDNDKLNSAEIDLLDNGPKNELYLFPEQAVTFRLAEDITARIGMHTVQGATSYQINGGSAQNITSSTDMFYDSVSGEVIITNTGDKVLAITLLKIFGEGNIFEQVGEQQVERVFYRLSTFASVPVDPTDPVDPTKPTDPVEPTEPEQPEVVYADATLSVSLVDYTGKQIASVDLTDNGVEGETKAFTAEEILAAAKANVPEGYVLVDESKVTGAEVAYGESGKVTVQIDKTATLKVIYVNLRGKNVGTATITKVQTSGSSCQFSASEIRANAPAGRRAVWLTNVRIPYGSERSIIVPVI